MLMGDFSAQMEQIQIVQFLNFYHVINLILETDLSNFYFHIFLNKNLKSCSIQNIKTSAKDLFKENLRVHCLNTISMTWNLTPFEMFFFAFFFEIRDEYALLTTLFSMGPFSGTHGRGGF